MHSHVAVIEPTRGAVLPRVREAWRARELLWFLTLRDLKVRYAQTVLGWLWALVQPLGMTLVFTFAFSKLGDVDTEGVPYPLFVLAGLAFWTFFQRAVSTGADSLVLNAALVTKTSAPRLLLPLSAIASAFVDLIIAVALFLVVAVLYGESFGPQLVLALPALALGALLATGLAVGLSAVNVRRRDIRNGLPFALQLLLFLSPIAYSLGEVGDAGLTLLALNPLVGIIEAFRWAVLDTPAPGAWTMASAVGITAGLLVVGAMYFSRVARDFADVA
jgi:ABC-type polysaccharide/polyol phosphate export permease